ncbi:MAG: M55 family metallopeptidase [Armatimonadota bacterium]|nr:MAG: M55 family metallopeptidase [Armatimonadota bacterium]
MKIYLLCDMEGTSGIWRAEQTDAKSPHCQQGRELLVGDVNAAIAGAIDGGAAELVACDTHGSGPNFLIEKMDERAEYETPSADSPMPSLDESFDGLILTGHHAMAGTLNGFLDHTMSSAGWFCFKINGRPVGEIGMETAHAGHFGVPLIMVTGDEAACREAEEQFPGVVTAAVKRGLGRNQARLMPLGKAHALIRERAAQAVAKAKELKPWRLEAPITLELTYYRSDMADRAAADPDAERVDARTVRKVVSTAERVCRF